MTFQFNMPVNIYCGENSLQILKTVFNKNSKKVLLVSSHEIESSIQKVKSILLEKKIFVESFFLENPEPSTKFIDSSGTAESNWK